jgi:protein involved in polysaccharide export with SLBB domain
MKLEFSHRAGRCFLALVCACALLVVNLEATAQLGDFPLDQLESLRKGAQGGSSSSQGDGEPGTNVQKYTGPEIRERPSRLEIFYSNRAGEPLLQFGYETFGQGRDVTLRKLGGVQDHYVIGVGDKILVDLRGLENRSHQLVVDSSGRVLLPDLKPVQAAGRKFGEFTAQMQQEVKAAFIGTQSFVSVQEVRQISVLVSGEVNNPGPVILNGLSTSVDALLLAGGIMKTGSMRDIKIFRGDEIIKIDLYSILRGHHAASDFSLMEGDRIHVSSIGRAIAIGGWVKRAGIYELSELDIDLSVKDVIELAGGFEVKGQYRISLLRTGKDGHVSVVDVGGTKSTVREGDIVLVEPNDERSRGAVYLEGHVRQTGTIAVAAVESLKTLLAGGDVFGGSVYMPFAIVARKDPSSLLKTYIPFSPIEVINGGRDIPLIEDDVIHIFSQEEVAVISETLRNRGRDVEQIDRERYLNSAGAIGQVAGSSAVGASASFAAGQAGTVVEIRDRTRENQPASNVGARRLGDIIDIKIQKDLALEIEQRAAAQARGEVFDSKRNSTTARDLLASGLFEMGSTGKIDLYDPALLSLFEESRMSFFGSVKAPGDYFVMPGISLGQALKVAGGPAIRADLSAVEITTTRFDPMQGTSLTDRRMVMLSPENLKNVKLGPFDVVRVRRVYTDRIAGSVSIMGEVKYPGQFDLKRGERLSSLMERAGGLTSVAYPYGAIFTRESAALAEKEARNKLVDRMENELGEIVASGDLQSGGAQFLSNLIVRMKQAPTIGRVTITAGPAVMMANSGNDLILEPGDRLVIPPRPSSVVVVGEVLSPSGYGFEPRLDGRDYIRLAGGFARSADKKRAFVIMPDGKTVRLRGSLWRTGDKMIAPGSVVVVPRNLRPFKWDEVLMSYTQIASQLALTAASLSVINN